MAAIQGMIRGPAADGVPLTTQHLPAATSRSRRARCRAFVTAEDEGPVSPWPEGTGA